jgi:hypothetical protein
MQSAALSTAGKDKTPRQGAAPSRYRPVDPLPKRAKPRSWWPFRRQEPDMALRLLAVHMGQVTPRR